MFWEANSSLRAQLEENCELWRTDNTKDKYPRIFSRQMNAIVLIVLQILFYNTRGFENWGISLGYSPVLAWEYSHDAFKPIARVWKYLMDL